MARINLNHVLRGVGNTDDIEVGGKFILSGIGATQATANAAGTTYTDGAVISQTAIAFTSVAYNNCAAVFTAFPGGSQRFVQNRGAVHMSIYAASGGSINGYQANTGITLASGASALFHAITNDNLIVGKLS